MKPAKTCFILLVLATLISLFLPDPAQAQGTFIRGDINCDGVVDTVDLRIFSLQPGRIECYDRFDVNDNGIADAADSVYLGNYLLFGGPPPFHPFPVCGFDTTPGPYGSYCAISCCCTLTTQCNDRIDNDGDGLTDYPEDGDCLNACDSLEIFLDQCKDGIDNDGDGFIDFPDDCGCESESDISEAPNPVTQCSDGIDNDGDGFTDYPDDCGCSNSCDSTEAPNPVRQCNDGIDNDGDGLIDLADTNCVDICDLSELSSVCTHKPGDFNGNGTINLTDLVGLVMHVFKGAPVPVPKCKGDANGNGSLTLTDIIYVANFVFKNGPDPIPSGVCCIPT